MIISRIRWYIFLIPIILAVLPLYGLIIDPFGDYTAFIFAFSFICFLLGVIGCLSFGQDLECPESYRPFLFISGVAFLLILAFFVYSLCKRDADLIQASYISVSGGYVLLTVVFFLYERFIRSAIHSHVDRMTFEITEKMDSIENISSFIRSCTVDTLLLHNAGNGIRYDNDRKKRIEGSKWKALIEFAQVHWNNVESVVSIYESHPLTFKYDGYLKIPLSSDNVDWTIWIKERSGLINPTEKQLSLFELTAQVHKILHKEIDALKMEIVRLQMNKEKALKTGTVWVPE